MQQAGLRWSQEGAQAVLDLRAVRLTEDGDASWQSRPRRQHARRYGAATPRRPPWRTRRWTWRHNEGATDFGRTLLFCSC